MFDPGTELGCLGSKPAPYLSAVATTAMAYYLVIALTIATEPLSTGFWNDLPELVGQLFLLAHSSSSQESRLLPWPDVGLLCDKYLLCSIAQKMPEFLEIVLASELRVR